VTRVLITMSRTWLDVPAVWTDLDRRLEASIDKDFVVVHGGAKPEKQFIEAWVATRSLLGAISEEHLADWTTHGRKAGILRNIYMVNLGADLCLAYIRNNSRGATHCATTAHMRGIETRITRQDDVDNA
jgi:hypothetical protein